MDPIEVLAKLLFAYSGCEVSLNAFYFMLLG